MPQIYTSIGEHTIEQLEKISKKTGKSFSKITAEMVELGLKVYEARSENQISEVEKKKAELEEKHTEYLLRIMNLCSEILRCTFDPDKMESKSKNPEEAISEIKEKMQFYIKSYTGIQEQ